MHKRIFLSLKLFFQRYAKMLCQTSVVRGFSLEIGGKISATGSSKKRTMRFNIGETTNTTKLVLKEKKYATIRTTTGVLGLTVTLLF